MRTRRLDLEFESRIAGMRTPANFVVPINRVTDRRPDSGCHYFSVRENGSFTIDTMAIERIAGRILVSKA